MSKAREQLRVWSNQDAVSG